MQLTLAVTGTKYYLKWFIWVFQKTQAHFRLGVKAKVELKSCISIGAITEISPKGFTLGVKGWKRKQFLKSTTLWPWLCPKAEKGYLSTW
jgi:hypothetical protein